MPTSMTRLVLAPCLLTFTWLCYWLIHEIFDRRLGWDDHMALLAADVIMGLVFTCGWIGVWWRSVNWNRFRWIATFVSMALAALMAVIYWSGLRWASNHTDDFYYITSIRVSDVIISAPARRRACNTVARARTRAPAGTGV